MRKIQPKHSLFLSLHFLFLIACKKNVDIEKEIIPTIQQFVISKEHNQSLLKDIEFEIKEDSLIASAFEVYRKVLVPTFTTTGLSLFKEDAEQVAGVTAQDFTDAVTYTAKLNDGTLKKYHAKIHWQPDSLPHIYISTEGGTPIDSKDHYINATLTIDGKQKYPDYQGATQIRGRGNSTWAMPKKPFRLKLSTKSEMFGLSAERDWILLANLIDPTLMLNAVAMKIGRQLETPFINTIVPVNVTLNGTYAGSYNFTQQIEVENNRVNIGKDGWLLELDVNYDEDFQFKSSHYDLPVMIKSPDLKSEAEISPIKEAFDIMTELVAAETFPNNEYKEHIDISSMADFLIVHLLTDNEEPNHPKSTYMHKTSTGKFTMGPIWDFDWAYGYQGVGGHFADPKRPFFWGGTHSGTPFFKRFLYDPVFVSLLQEKWSDYRSTHFEELLDFVDEYAFNIHTSRNEDWKIWKIGNEDFMSDVSRLKKYLNERAEFLDIFINAFRGI